MKKKRGYEHHYAFLCNVPIDLALRDIRDDTKAVAEYGGHTVGVSSLRLITFAVKGTTCSACNLPATHFAVNTNGSGPHLNLWGRTQDGKLMLFTHDHTLARSLGGVDNIDNCTTMCAACNSEKSKLERPQTPRTSTKKMRREDSKAKVIERAQADPNYRQRVVAAQRQLGRNDYNFDELKC